MTHEDAVVNKVMLTVGHVCLLVRLLVRHNSSMSQQMRNDSHLEEGEVFIIHRSLMDERRQSHSCHYWISLMMIISCHFLSDSASAA